MPPSPRRVLGIVVAYRPDPPSLARAISAVRAEVDRLVVVDNASSPDSREAIAASLRSETGADGRPLAPAIVVPSSENEGIGRAFNRGIDVARTEGFDLVFLLDQDSVPSPGSVGRLRDEYALLSGRFRVGALQAFNEEADGRIPLDSRRREYYRDRGFFVGAGSYQGLLLLNSGSLVPLEVLGAVGGFDPRYFLDFADYEFSLRLARRGFLVFHVPGAIIRHNVSPAGGPSPVRLYYAIRELLPLVRSYGWSLPSGVAPVVWTTMSRVGSALLRSSSRTLVLSLCLRAVFDGLKGRSGEFAPTRRAARDLSASAARGAS